MGGICIIGAEIVLLILVGFLPDSFSDMIVNALVSLVAAIQFNSFRKMEGLPLQRAFCTGNLRSMTEHLHKFIFKRDRGLWIGLKYFRLSSALRRGFGRLLYYGALVGPGGFWYGCSILILLVTYMIVSYLHLKKADTL